MDRICATCDYWKYTCDTKTEMRTYRYGDCRCCCPHPFIVNDFTGSMNFGIQNWPVTEQEDWCGDWRNGDQYFDEEGPGGDDFEAAKRIVQEMKEFDPRLEALTFIEEKQDGA